MLEILIEISSSPNFWGIFIPAIVAIFIFHRNKAAERESEWRKEKLRLYLQFIESLSGITGAEKSKEGEIALAKACNDLHALSPVYVLKALHLYQNEMSVSNIESTSEKRQIVLNNLIWEMRRDLKIQPSEIPAEFKMSLSTSGTK